MSLTLGQFYKSVARLEEVLSRYQSEPDDLVVRDSLIKRFEFTYELAYKMLRRQLSLDVTSPERVAAMTFGESVREGWARGLLKEELATWKQFRESRNRTSHTYDEVSAQEVCAVIPRFLAEAKFLLSQLEKRNEDDADD